MTDSVKRIATTGNEPAPEAPKPAPKLKRIGGTPTSTPATREATFQEVDLGEIDRRGAVSKTVDSLTKAQFTRDKDFSSGAYIQKAGSGVPVTDARQVNPTQDSVMIGDQRMTVATAVQLGYLENISGTYVLSDQGKGFVQERAGKVESIKQPDAGFLDADSKRALELLEYKTRGRFAAILPSLFQAHVEGKALDYDTVTELSKAAGCKPEVMQGMISEIAESATDRACQVIGSREGLSPAQVFTMVQAAGPKTQRRFLTSVTLGDVRGAQDIVRALRRRDLK